MATKSPLRAERLQVLFLVNLLVAIIAPALLPGPGGLLANIVAFLIGYIVLGLFDRSYLRAMFWGTVFLLYLIWEIILSNFAIAWLVIQPRPKLDPGIVAVPLRLTTGLEITMLASAITLTPGTLSVDLGEGENGQPILFVHNLKVTDPEAYRASVSAGFEPLILRIFGRTHTDVV